MTAPLYLRGAETLLRPGRRMRAGRPVLRCGGSRALPPPSSRASPEGAVYNNALLERELAAAERADAPAAIEAAYAAAGRRCGPNTDRIHLFAGGVPVD